MEDEREEVEVFVVGLVLDPSSNAPIVVLKDVEGETCLPIWIGLAEATAIASALKKVEINRPMTHDLLSLVIDELGGQVTKVLISDLRDNTFIASIEIVVGDKIKVLDARPSDAIALAVRTDARISVKADVLKQAQVTLVSVSAPDEEGGEIGKTAKDFTNIDKEQWEEILAEMDPEDFKYKM